MAIQLSIYFNSFALHLTLRLSTAQFAPAFMALARAVAVYGL